MLSNVLSLLKSTCKLKDITFGILILKDTTFEIQILNLEFYLQPNQTSVEVKYKDFQSWKDF